jgi:hypothetical protein
VEVRQQLVNNSFSGDMIGWKRFTTPIGVTLVHIILVLRILAEPANDFEESL